MSGVAGPSRTLSAADVLHAQLGVWYMQAPYAESDDAACAEVGVCLWLARLVAGVEPPPRSYAEYLHLLHAALDGNCAFTNDGRRGREAHVHSVSDWLAAQVKRMESKPNGVVLLLQDLQGIFPLEPNNPPTQDVRRRIGRRSMLGIFLRRVRLAVMRLDEAGMARLCAEMVDYIDGTGQEREDKAPQRAQRAVNKRHAAWLKYEKAHRAGDYTGALRQMSYFFDMFPLGAPSPIKVLHHHALLHLAYFHFETGGLAESRSALKDAIHMARLLSDTDAILACDSLVRRLDLEARDEAVVGLTTSEVSRPAIRPPYELDDLWEADHDSNEGAPLYSVLARLVEGIWLSNARPQPSRQISLGPSLPRTSVARSSYRTTSREARIWHELGHARVAAPLRESCWAASVQRARAHEAEVRLECASGEAWQLAEAGNFDAALAVLLDADLCDSLSAQRYARWQAEVLRVVWLQARRRGDAATMHELRLRRPEIEKEVDGVVAETLPLANYARPADVGEGDRKQDRPAAKLSLLDSLRLARELATAQQGAAALDALLSFLAQAERQDRIALHRQGLVLLAELQAEHLDMAAKACATMEEVLPAALADHNAEHRGDAAFTYGRALLARGQEEPRITPLAAVWFDRAAEAYRVAGALMKQAAALCFRAELNQAAGEPFEQLVDALEAVEEQAAQYETALQPEATALEVLELVVQVGVRLATSAM